MGEQLRLLVASQASIALFALVLTYAPHLYLVVILAYILGMAWLTAVAQRRFGRGAKLDDVLSARRLFEESRAMDVAVQDEELARELSGQLRLLASSLVGLGAAIAAFAAISAVRDQLVAVLAGFTGSEGLARFLYWVLVFEVLFGVSRLAVKLAGGRRQQSQPPFIPSRYVVTEKGIAVPGVLGVAVAFPLPEGYSVRVDERRRFVEIADGRGRRLRLYTRNPRRLYELIVRLNRRAPASRAPERREGRGP